MNSKPKFISYAQNAEDIVLNRAFRDKPEGFYIDVGAYDPVELSVTKLFYDRGWHGINIEPVPVSFKKLEAHRPRDLNLNIALGALDGSRTLYESNGHPECSTLDPGAAANTSQILNVEFTKYQVPVQTLAGICERYAEPEIDFLKIDVEGPESDVIAGGDFEKFRPVMLAIESTIPCSGTVDSWMKQKKYDWDGFGDWQNWEPGLLESGYLMVYYDGLNRYYLREENAELKTRFCIPISFMQDGFSLGTEIQEMERLKMEATTLRQQVGELEEKIRHLGAETDVSPTGSLPEEKSHGKETKESGK